MKRKEKIVEEPLADYKKAEEDLCIKLYLALIQNDFIRWQD
ncbi:MAG: hypothetical protein WC622_15345 [Pedobacter sp.]|jgi:hypothetical protein